MARLTTDGFYDTVFEHHRDCGFFPHALFFSSIFPIIAISLIGDKVGVLQDECAESFRLYFSVQDRVLLAKERSVFFPHAFSRFTQQLYLYEHGTDAQSHCNQATFESHRSSLHPFDR